MIGELLASFVSPPLSGELNAIIIYNSEKWKNIAADLKKNFSQHKTGALSDSAPV